MTEPTQPTQIHAADAARRLGVSRQRVSALCKSGKLVSYTDTAGTLWVTVASVEVYAASDNRARGRAALLRFAAAGAPDHEGSL